MKDAINIFSPNWEVQDSYGRIACELAGGFQSKGYHVNQLGDGVLHGFIRPAFGGLFLGYPTLYKEFYEQQFGALTQGPRVAITMFESTILPDGWVEALNTCDATVVPARFLVDVFTGNGVFTPIHVHPLGMSCEFLTHNMRSKRRPMKFLAIADRGLRKGWQKAIHAFVTAFGEDMNYHLTLKCREHGALSRLEFTNPNIDIVAEDYSNANMAELYRQHDVMIFPTCGEGFGLPPREFAGTGGIAIATNWSGTADDVREWGIPLSHSMQVAWASKSDWNGQLGEWANVEIEELSRLLLLIANNFDSFASDALKSAQFVHQEYQWSSFVDGVESVWKQVKERAYASAG